MKTEDLIAALAADLDEKPAPLGRVFARDALAGFALATLGFFVFLGLRRNFFDSLDSPRFLFKFLFSGSMAFGGLVMAWRLARPDVVSARTAKWVLVAPALALLACGAEMATAPPAQWAQRLWGENFLHCLVAAPLLSVAPLVGLFAFLRHAAPAEPGKAGAAAGFAACGLGAFLYAANCPDDSPFYVAVWYLLASALVAGLGWFAGGRLLRW